MPTVTAYSKANASTPIEKTTIERRDPVEHDVVIDIKFAGICHSDIHTGRGEWGTPSYPVTTGHEIVGVVSAVGPDATKYKIGDRVGVGCFVDSCRECSACLSGNDHKCERGIVGTYNSIDKYGKPTHGGYSSSIVVDERYVLSIPDSIEMHRAAPLLCAGITTYSPLRRWQAGPGKKVAVVGLGGLGHMGVQLAHAMGAEVSVISQSLKKMEDGLRLGADNYYAADNPETFEQLKNKFDIVLNTVSSNIDLDAYVSTLGLFGVFIELGAPEHPLSIKTFTLLNNNRSLTGSGIGSIKETQEMLDFCAEKGIGAEVEVIPASKVNEAWDRVVASDVRYRFVIDISTIDD